MSVTSVIRSVLTESVELVDYSATRFVDVKTARVMLNKASKALIAAGFAKPATSSGGRGNVVFGSTAGAYAQLDDTSVRIRIQPSLGGASQSQSEYDAQLDRMVKKAEHALNTVGLTLVLVHVSGGRRHYLRVG